MILGALVASTTSAAAAQRTQLQAFFLTLTGWGMTGVLDGEWLLLGSANNPDPAFQRLHKRGPEGWTEISVLPAPSHLGFLEVPRAHAMHQGWVAVGAPSFDQRRGTVQLRRLDASGNIVVDQRIDAPTTQTIEFGHSVSLLDDVLAIGAPNRAIDGAGQRGEIWIYELEAGQWVARQTIRPGLNAVNVPYLLGFSVWLFEDLLFSYARDGNVGAVHIYQRDSSGMYLEIQVLRPSNPQTFDNFGRALAACEDLLLVGKPRNSTARGEAILYRRNVATGLYQEVHQFRSHLPAPPSPANQSNYFGSSVGLWNGIVAVGDGRAWDPVHDEFGGVFVYRPDASGGYHSIADEVLRAEPGLMENLGNLGPIHFQDGLLTAVGFGRGSVPRSVVAFSVGPEVELCSAPGGVSSSGFHLDTYVDREAGPAPAGGPRRGVLLSGLPAGTRYIVLGSISGQALPAGSLLGVAGLCLAPSFERIAFGASSGPHGLTFAGPPTLAAAAEHFLTTSGTIYLQALCFPPPGAGAPRWSNGVTLVIE